MQYCHSTDTAQNGQMYTEILWQYFRCSNQVLIGFDCNEAQKNAH